MIVGIDCHHLIDQKGIERYLLNLLKFWKNEKDIRFILYLRDNKSVPKIPIGDNFEPKILKRPFNFSSTAFFQHVLLPFRAKKDKVDFLFSPSYFLPIFYRGKTAVTIHDIIYEAHSEWFNFGIFDKILVRWVGRKSARKADLIFTPSEFSKKEIIKFYKVNADKIKVTPLAADEIFKPKKDDKALKNIKEKYGIKKNYFLFTAAIFDRRCVSESILAFEKIAQKYPDFQYLIIGKDLTCLKNIKELSEKVNQLCKRSAIVYVPDFVANKEMVELYNGAHASIYLSLYEGFGLPPLESILCHKPAICGNAEVFKEILEDACFWVDDPKNINSIQKIMEQVIEDKKVYDQIKEQGIKRAQEFSWEKCAQRTLLALRQIV